MKVYGQLERAQFENLTADPSVTAKGYVYFNTTVNRFKVYNGTTWVDIEDTLNTHIASTVAHGTTGNVVGTSDAQVLTNKDIDGGTAANTRRITVPKDTFANISALTRKEGTILYATDSDRLYVDDGSTLIEVGTGSSGVILSAYNSAGTVTANTAIAAGWVENKDTHSAFTSGVYTVVVPGDYLVIWTAATTSGTPTGVIYKNGSLYATGMTAGGSQTRTTISALLTDLVATNTIFVSLNSSLTLTTSTTDSVLSIYKV